MAAEITLTTIKEILKKLYVKPNFSYDKTKMIRPLIKWANPILLYPIQNNWNNGFSGVVRNLSNNPF